MELKAKKIDPAIISEVVSDIDFDESEILNSLFQNKWKKLKKFLKTNKKEKLLDSCCKEALAKNLFTIY